MGRYYSPRFPDRFTSSTGAVIKCNQAAAARKQTAPQACFLLLNSVGKNEPLGCIESKAFTAHGCRGNIRCFSTAGRSSGDKHDLNRWPRLSVAVVGAGPSGMYAAKYITSSVLKRIQATVTTENVNVSTTDADAGKRFAWAGIDVDIIERLPTPYGLVRYGVAPDHPEVKNVENDFASLFQSEIASAGGPDSPPPSRDSSISYFGNVMVGRDIPLSHLQSLYHIVILAYGCQADDKRLGIMGEDYLEGVLSAREFVAWYNGHPEFDHVGDIVERCLWSKQGSQFEKKDAIEPLETVSSARVVVVGQGNVALDCARILAKGRPGLVNTDIPSNVLHILKGGVSHVSVVGRRGHVQGAFTIKELRELTKLGDEGHEASFIVRDDELQLGMTSATEIELTGPGGRPKTRIDKLLRSVAKTISTMKDELLNYKKNIELRFLLSPTRLEPSNFNPSRVGRVVCERTNLEGQPSNQKSVGTGEMEMLPADLVLVSIGYRGKPLAGADDICAFNNEKGVIVSNHGKVSGSSNLFVTGWIKRGPSGIIGTNIVDAKDTVATVMKWIDSGALCSNNQKSSESGSTKGRTGLQKHLHTERIDYVCWHEFEQIDAAERKPERLRSNMQPREKILSINEMLQVAKCR